LPSGKTLAAIRGTMWTTANMRQLLFLILILLLTSCDCFITNRGTVIDKLTKEPLNDVKVYMTIKRTSLQNLAYQWDSLTIKQRDSIKRNNPELKKKWKREQWHYPMSDIRKYVKNIPCTTDSIGNYDLYFFGPYCPNFSFRFIKSGYKDLVISRDSLYSIPGHHDKRLIFELTRQ
jgi:hypothetical protein